VLSTVLATVGIGTPGHLRLSPAWWIAIFLAAMTLLFARSAYRSQSLLNPSFPNHRVDFGNPWYATPADFTVLENDLVLFEVTYTNRENRRVNLEIDLFWEWELAPGRLIGPFRLRLNTQPRGTLRLWEEVLDVAPESTESRYAAFDTDAAAGMKQGHFHDLELEPDHRVFVRLTDRVTGAELRQPLPVRTISSAESAEDEANEADDEADDEAED
jgi:hypothetical protein